MAEKKIYTTHNFQVGANVKNLKLEDVSNAAASGELKFDDGRFYLNNGSGWAEVVDTISEQTILTKTIGGGSF
tara:strand:+ start:1337 stop:1555 length:219 start_codon:yes stop_codon:yes gene_type:complete